MLQLRAKANSAYGPGRRWRWKLRFQSAIDLAGESGELRDDATLRGLLGNAYFAADASLRRRLRDALALRRHSRRRSQARWCRSPKARTALSTLEAFRYYLDAVDYGLAVALRPQRQCRSSSRLPARRALTLACVKTCLAYAPVAIDCGAQLSLRGDPPDRSMRVQQWMALAAGPRVRSGSLR